MKNLAIILFCLLFLGSQVKADEPPTRSVERDVWYTVSILVVDWGRVQTDRAPAQLQWTFVE